MLLGFADMQGRLQGKRLVGSHFVHDVIEHGAEACNYLLAVDVEMNTVAGYEMSSWETGYGDFEMKPDFDTLRPVSWFPGTALCLADLQWADGSPVVASPRQILRGQLDRLAERGWNALAATELEFIVFRDTYEQAFHKGYRGLDPGNLYNVDYSMLGTSRLEPLLGRIRREMAASDLPVENSKGECNFGQHEVNFTYADALTAADVHLVYKNAAKEIAAQEGMAITFMAKYDEREGNSCHIHLSLRDEDDKPVFADQPEVFDSFLAGQLACLQELTLFMAPNVNSYKRYVEGSFAPTAVAWGRDNRTCSLRVIGHGPSLRLEQRAPGGDVNPYLALASMIAAGLHGVDQGLELEPPLEGNAYTADKPHVPSTLRAARDLFAGSAVAREAFGEPVVDPLPQQRRRRAARVRGGGDGLGALPGVRAPVMPVIGLCTALERAQWSVWDQEAVLLPRSYADAVQRAGGVAVLLPPDPRAGEDPSPWLEHRRRADPGRRRRRRPELLRRRARSRDARHGARAGRVRDRAHARGDGARPPAARHLPRDAGDERGPRRDPDPAPAGRRRPPRPPALAGLVRRRRPRRAPRRGLAGAAGRGRGRSTPPSRTTTKAWRASARASRSRAGRRSTTSPRRSRTPPASSRSACSGTPRPTRRRG